MTFETSAKDQYAFTASVRCIDTTTFISNNTVPVDFCANNSLVCASSKIEVSEVPKTIILLVSQNVMDRLNISYILEELHLIDNLVDRLTPDEAMEYLEELHNDFEVKNGVAVLIFDMDLYKSTVKQIV